MNSVNPTPFWVRLIIIFGVMSAIVGSFSFAGVLWAEIGLKDSRNDIVAILPLAMPAWLLQIVCGVIVLRWSKIIGRILIWLGIIFFGLVLLFAKSR
jgi:hypothetical protein